MIDFRFLRNGLSLDEDCIYATEEDSGSIVLKMLNYGFSLKYFQTGRLKVYQIQRGGVGREEIMDNCKRDLDRILSNVRVPFRIVSRLVADVSTTDAISVELELERLTHKKFEDFGGSLICPYDLSKIESSEKKQWIKELIENHHTVIYAPRFGEGGVFTSKN